MAHSRRIAKVKDCIAYIETCGWTMKYYNRPWYCFQSNGRAKTWTGTKEITFTLTELRHALNNGW